MSNALLKMNQPTIEVISTLNPQSRKAIEWFLAGDLSYIGLDTETMGIHWLEAHRQLPDLQGHWDYWKAIELSNTLPADKPYVKTMKKQARAALKDCEKTLKVHQWEALNPKSNYLATLQLSTSDGRALIFVLKEFSITSTAQDLIKYLMQQQNIVWVIQNAKFDIHQLSHHWGLDFSHQRIHDTQLCEVLLLGNQTNDRVNLLEITRRYPLPDGIQKLESTARVSDWWDQDLTPEQIAYAGADVLVLPPLAKLQKEKMKERQLLRVRELECRLVPKMVDLENVGVQFNHNKMFDFLIRAKEIRKQKLQVFQESFGNVNFKSAQQMLVKIKERYGVIPTQRRYNKEFKVYEQVESVDKYALLEAGLLAKDEQGEPIHPELEAFITLKEISKRVQQVEKWVVLPEGKLFVNFFQLPIHGGEDSDDGGARTGRITTSPQLQNFDNFTKQFLEAPAGWVIGSADYAGIELCIMASLAQDQTMLEALNAGRSLHKEACIDWFDMKEEDIDKHGKPYRIAKEANFGFLYWMGGPGFCRRVLRATEGAIRLSDDEGWDFHRRFFCRYPMVKEYHRRQLAFGAQHGFVETRLGRRRYYNESDRPKLDGNKQTKSFWDPSLGRMVTPLESPWACYRAADWKWRNVTANFPDQGTGADGLKQALSLLLRRFNPERAKVFGTVHDSIDYLIREEYIDKAVREVHACMIDGMQPLIPDVQVRIEHTVGKSWAAQPKDIRTEVQGLWYYPRNLNDTDLKEWMDSALQTEYVLS